MITDFTVGLFSIELFRLLSEIKRFETYSAIKIDIREKLNYGKNKSIKFVIFLHL